MENKNYDLKLAGYIWSILKTQPVIVMSWGVDMDTIKPVKGGLEFHVQIQAYGNGTNHSR